MINAVLFDFDGVIANTIQYHVQAWNKVFQSYGIHIVLEDVATEEGARAIEIATAITKKKQLSLTEAQLKDLTRIKREIYSKISNAKIYPEIEDFIQNLQKKALKLGLVTGSIMSAIKLVVSNRFLDYFQIIITSEDVTNSKPDPEPYLVAARRLQITPADCIVIENAPKGIRAAKRAGMFCIALRTTIQNDELLKEADLIVNAVSEINIQALGQAIL